MMYIECKGTQYKFPKLIDDRFRVGSKLDKGCFGTLFECQDLKDRQTYAIKVIPIRMNSDYKREAQVLEELKQSNFKGICKLIKHGKCSNDVYYIVMEKYGPSIKNLLRKAKYG